MKMLVYVTALQKGLSLVTSNYGFSLCSQSVTRQVLIEDTKAALLTAVGHEQTVHYNIIIIRKSANLFCMKNEVLSVTYSLTALCGFASK